MKISRRLFVTGVVTTAVCAAVPITVTKAFANQRPHFFDVDTHYLIRKLANDVISETRGDINNSVTQRRVVEHISNQMTVYKHIGRINDFQIICDSRNNTPDIIDANEINLDVYYKLNKTVEFFHLETVQTPANIVSGLYRPC